MFRLMVAITIFLSLTAGLFASERDDIFSSTFIVDLGRKVHLPSRLGVRPLREMPTLRAGQSFRAEITAVGVVMKQGITKAFRKQAAKFERGDKLDVLYMGRDGFKIVYVEPKVRRRIRSELIEDEESQKRPSKRKPKRRRRLRAYQGPITWHAFGMGGEGLLAELPRGKSVKGKVVDPKKLRSFGKPYVSFDETGLDFAPNWRMGEPLWVTHMRDGKLRIKTRARNKQLTLFVLATRWEKAPRRRGPRVKEQTNEGRLEVQLTRAQAQMARTRERFRYVSIKPTGEQRRRLMKVFKLWDGEGMNIKGAHIGRDLTVFVKMDGESLKSVR